MKDNEWEHKAERVLKHAARGPECWDCEFYQSSNADLAELPCHDAFAHFVNYGQFEPSRPFRCVPDRTVAMHALHALLATQLDLERTAYSERARCMHACMHGSTHTGSNLAAPCHPQVAYGVPQYET